MLFYFLFQKINKFSDEVYLGRFGSFLCNNERERLANQLPQRTLSIWSFVAEHRLRFSNIFFAPRETCLRGSACLRHLHFWRAFFLRYESPLAHPDDMERIEDR